MKKSYGIIGVILAVCIAGALAFGGYYNSFVTANETVNQQWAQVETVYQRRADLIPNLVATVQGAADFESETQTKIAELRTAANAAKEAWDNAATRDERVAAAENLDAVANGFRALNINVENYPQLRATENFQTLQTQLEGTENRIAVERRRYNETVQSYNTMVKRFPGNLMAGLFGFDEATYFEAEQGSEQAPEVKF